MKSLNVSKVVLLGFGIFLCNPSAFAQDFELTYPKTTIKVENEEVNFFTIMPEKFFSIEKAKPIIQKVRKKYFKLMNSGEHEYEMPDTSKLNIVLVENVERWKTFIQNHPKELPQLFDSNGFYHEHSNTIYFYWDRSKKDPFEAARLILAHEYVHHLNELTFNTDWRREPNIGYLAMSAEWVKEGSANWIAYQALYHGKITAQDIENIKKIYDENKRFHTILDITQMKRSSGGLYYVYGAPLIQFVIDHGKKDELIKILETLLKPDSTFADKIQALFNTITLEYINKPDHVPSEKNPMEVAFENYLKKLIDIK